MFNLAMETTIKKLFFDEDFNLNVKEGQDDCHCRPTGGRVNATLIQLY